MIDDKIKNAIFANLPKVLEHWSKEKRFTNPKPRWFMMTKLRHNPENVHYILALIVGKDEKETMQRMNELAEWHKKYTADQNDVSITEDFTERTF